MRLWLRKLLAVIRKRPLDTDLSAELASHVEMLTADNVAAGMSPEEARRQARIAVGNLGVAHELHRDARGLPSLESGLQDLRYACRTLGRDYGFTIVAVLILGLGIGANTVVFSLVDALLLQPLPFAESDRLLWVSNGEPGETNPSLLASRVLTFGAWRDGSTQVADLAAYSPFFTRASWALTGDGKEPERLKGVRVTDNLLPLLGVPLHLGRSFTPEEVSTDGPAAVIISHRLWEQRFGADPEIVGQPIELNDNPWTVVGVTPPGFDFGSLFAPGYQVDVLLPAILDAMDSWGNTLSVVGRLAPAATIASARQELQTITSRLAEERPELEGWVVFARVSGLQDHVSAPIRNALWLLWGAVGMVLLIVCANLANLMLVRGVARRRELAVRVALGAGKTRLVRQLVTESAVLAALGVTVGIGLAAVALRAIVSQQAVVLPLLERARIDATVIAVATLTTGLVALIVGMIPALQVSRSDPFAALGPSSRGAVGEPAEHWSRSTLVVAEIALACTLLIGAGLLARSFGRILDVELGFEPTHRASFEITAGARYADRAEVDQFQRHLLATIRELPGVVGATLTDNLPLDGNRSWGFSRADAAEDEQTGVSAFVRLVADDYFSTMGIPILSGRGLSADDTADAELVIVINQTAATTVWPDRDPVGATVSVPGGEARVVGVVSDVRHNGLHEASGPEMYLSLSQYWTRSVSVVVRTAGDPLALAGQLRGVVQEVDPRLPFTDFRPLSSLVDRAVSARRFVMAMLAGFAAMAVALASLGIYGVVSYSVGRRRPEIGVRLALGAQARRVLREELRRGVTMALAGLALGLVGALFASRVLGAQLYQVGTTDPATYAAMAATLLAVALLAAYLPARRAARIDPVTALRDD